MATEKRLIELIECLERCSDNTDCESCSRWLYPCDEHCVDDLLATAAKELKKLVDAVEVVHGRWEIFGDGYGCELMCCSVCKSEFYDGDNDTVDHTHNYCPNCGAKMDGDRNGN